MTKLLTAIAAAFLLVLAGCATQVGGAGGTGAVPDNQWNSPYPDYASPGIVGHCLGLIERYGQAAAAHRALAASHRLAAAQAE